eukprot:936981_1
MKSNACLKKIDFKEDLFARAASDQLDVDKELSPIARQQVDDDHCTDSQPGAHVPALTPPVTRSKRKQSLFRKEDNNSQNVYDDTNNNSNNSLSKCSNMANDMTTSSEEETNYDDPDYVVSDETNQNDSSNRGSVESSALRKRKKVQKKFPCPQCGKEMTKYNLQ